MVPILFLVIAAVFLHAEDGEAQKQRCKDAYHKRDAAIRIACRAAESSVARRKARDKEARKRAAHTGKQRRTGGELVAHMRVRPQRGDHAPIGDVVHGVSDAVHEVNNAEEPDKAPALQVGVEREVDDDRRRHDADDEPRLELAPARACALDYIAHYRVVERIKDTRADHYRRDGGKLRRVKLACEKNIREYEICEEIVYHISSDSSQRVHYEVFLPQP